MDVAKFAPETCDNCSNAVVAVSIDAESSNGYLCTMRCSGCGNEYQTVLGDPDKQQQSKDKLKDILDVVGD